MTEFIEEEKSEGIDLRRYLDIIRRRHLHFLLPVFFVWLVVWGISWVLPARYKSGTLILVEQPTMPKDYVVPNVSDDLQGRLQSITQQILSRTRLLLIIDKLHLYDEKRHPISIDDKVNLMRKDINIELVHDPQRNEITAFQITYSAHDPHVAQQVTSELTNLFISDNLEVRQRESEEVTQFIEGRLENARTSLAEQEAQVQKFEQVHGGELPSDQARNLQSLSGLQAQLQNEQDALNSAKQRRVVTQTLLDQSRTLHTAQGSNGGAPPVTSPIDQELDGLKTKLASLSPRYTDRYPDVQILKDEIAAAEKLKKEHQGDSKSQGNDGSQLDGASAHAPLNSPTQQLQTQLQSAQAEIASREGEVTGLQSKVNAYQARLSAEATVEQQLAYLTRGYDQAKAEYDDLLKKKNESEMATSIEQLQQGERFSILDPPSLPTNPDSPNRVKMCVIGLGLGLVTGLIVVFGFEYVDDRLHSDREIKSLLPVEVISEIPEILSHSQERRSKMRMVLRWSLDAMTVSAIAVGSAYSYLHR